MFTLHTILLEKLEYSICF